jgi:hypothetical protein
MLMMMIEYTMGMTNKKLNWGEANQEINDYDFEFIYEFQISILAKNYDMYMVYIN